MIFKNIFAENFAEKFGNFAEITIFCKKMDDNIGVWEKRQFFAENCQKSQKIMIITSTPGSAGSIFL
jgi:hypothetical protein